MNKDTVSNLEGRLQEDPKDSYALRSLGDYHRDRGEIDRALKYYKRDIDCNPKPVVPLGKIITMLSKAGRRDEAVPYAEQCLEIDPEDVGMQVFLAKQNGTRAHVTEGSAFGSSIPPPP